MSDSHQVKDIQLVVGSDPPIFELNLEVSCRNNLYRKRNCINPINSSTFW